MGVALRYELLGPLRVVDGHGIHTVPAKKMQVTLGLLVILHDQVVSKEKLIYEVWRDQPPRRAVAGIHVYISHIRKLLATRSPQESRIVTTSSGYMLRLLESETADFEDFQRNLDAGKEYHRSRRYEEAMGCLADALDMWRGPALDEIQDGPVVNGFVIHHDELRLECIELMVSAALALGRHRETVGFLYSLVHDHPFHEDFYQKLMLALYRSGRRADALRVYQSARETLRAELGLEPSVPLQQLQHRILTADPGRAESVS